MHTATVSNMFLNQRKRNCPITYDFSEICRSTIPHVPYIKSTSRAKNSSEHSSATMAHLFMFCLWHQIKISVCCKLMEQFFFFFFFFFFLGGGGVGGGEGGGLDCTYTDTSNPLWLRVYEKKIHL